MSDPRSLNEPVRCLSSALRRKWQPAAWPSGLVAHRFFRNEFAGYAYNIGEDGLPYVEIIEGMLVEK